MSNEYNNGLKDGYDDGIEESEEGILTKEEIRKMIEEEGLVEDFIDLDVQLQPAGIDLTIKQICVLKKMQDFTNSCFFDARKQKSILAYIMKRSNYG